MNECSIHHIFRLYPFYLYHRFYPLTSLTSIKVHTTKYGWWHPLNQILGRMLDMIVRKASHRIITMIVIRLVPDLDTLHAGVFGRFFEILRKKLTLFVEVVSGSLGRHTGVSTPSRSRAMKRGGGEKEHTTSIRTSKFPPFLRFTNSVASCSFHFAWSSSPKYPPNAFCPHWQLIGLQIGANAETDLYFPGLRRYYITASS